MVKVCSTHSAVNQSIDRTIRKARHIDSVVVQKWKDKNKSDENDESPD